MSSVHKNIQAACDEHRSVDGQGGSRRVPSKIWPISDLHLHKDEGWQDSEIPDADVAVVAGDVCEGVVAAVEWLAAHIRPRMEVIYVVGNHEFYGTLHNHALMMGRDAAAATNIHLLDGDAVTIKNVKFIGATLWTDYRLFGSKFRDAAMMTARLELNDHRRIAWQKEPWLRFRPQEAAQLHEQAKRAIEHHLGQEWPGATVVVTHHAPHRISVAERFRNKLLSAAYASDVSDIIARFQPQIWIHGHTHSAADYPIGHTRILSNPRGYVSERETIGFAPGLVVEV